MKSTKQYHPETNSKKTTGNHNAANSHPVKPNGKQAVHAVEFPTIVINDVNTVSPPKSSNVFLNTRNSLDLHSVFPGEYRESNDSHNHPDAFPVGVTTATTPGGGTAMQLHFTVPKLAAMINLNKSPRSLNNTRTISSDSGYGPIRGTRPLSRGITLNNYNLGTSNNFLEELGSQETANANNIIEEEAQQVPTAKPLVLSTRPNIKPPHSSHSPRPNPTAANAPSHPPKSNIVLDHHGTNNNDNETLGAVMNSRLPLITTKAYVDPLTQEKTYLNPEQQKQMKENKSLKELLFDALEDFYVQHENLQSETDYQVLEKVGLPQTEIKAIRETVATRRSLLSVTPNLVTVQVSKDPSSPKGDGQQPQHNVTITDNIPIQKPAKNEKQPLAYEVRKMFDEEIFPAEHLKQTNMMISRSQKASGKGPLTPSSPRGGGGTGTGPTVNNNQQPSRNAKRPNSAHVLGRAGGGGAATGASSKIPSVTVQKRPGSHHHSHRPAPMQLQQQQLGEDNNNKPPFQFKKMNKNNYKYLFSGENPEEMPANEDLYINSKPYSAHPLYQYEQQQNPQNPHLMNDDLMSEDHRMHGEESNIIQQYQRQLASPRTTTIMLLSHEILSKHEQVLKGGGTIPIGVNAPGTGNNPQQQPPPKNLKSYDVPIIVSQPAGAKPSVNYYLSYNNQAQQQQQSEDPTSLTQPRNQKRILQIVETELLNEQIRKLKSGLVSGDNLHHGQSSEELLLLPDDLTRKMKKQLNRYNEITHPNNNNVNQPVPHHSQLAVDDDHKPHQVGEAVKGGEEPQLKRGGGGSGSLILNSNTNLLAGELSVINEEPKEEKPSPVSVPLLQWKGFLQSGNTPKIMSSREKEKEKEKEKAKDSKPVSSETMSNKDRVQEKMIKNQKKVSIDPGVNQQPHDDHQYIRQPRRGSETSEVDMDFMNISDSLYLNDAVYYSHKATNQQQLKLQTPLQPPVIPQPQGEAVKLNKEIPSNRIDKKFGGHSFHYSQPEPQPVLMMKAKAAAANNLMNSGTPPQGSSGGIGPPSSAAMINGENSPKKNNHLKQFLDKEKHNKRIQNLKIETSSMKMIKNPATVKPTTTVHYTTPVTGTVATTSMSINSNTVTNAAAIAEGTSAGSPKSIDGQNTITTDTIANLSSSQTLMKAPALKPAPPPIAIEFHINSTIPPPEKAIQVEAKMMNFEYPGIAAVNPVVSRPMSSNAGGSSRPMSAAAHRKIIPPS